MWTTQLDAAVRIRAADISDVRRVAGKFNAAAANLVDERCKSPFADTPARARVWFTTHLWRPWTLSCDLPKIPRCSPLLRSASCRIFNQCRADAVSRVLITCIRRPHIACASRDTSGTYVWSHSIYLTVLTTFWQTLTDSLSVVSKQIFSNKH